MTGALTEGISVANATTAVISELLAGSADACKPSSYELHCAFLAARRLRSCADSMTYVIEFHMLSVPSPSQPSGVGAPARGDSPKGWNDRRPGLRSMVLHSTIYTACENF